MKSMDLTNTEKGGSLLRRTYGLKYFSFSYVNVTLARIQSFRQYKLRIQIFLLGEVMSDIDIME